MTKTEASPAARQSQSTVTQNASETEERMSDATTEAITAEYAKHRDLAAKHVDFSPAVKGETP